jgi:hypothetical protein
MLRIEHPVRPGVRAEAGHDPIAGFFVDIVYGEQAIATYDCFHPLFNRSRPVIGCLDFLVSQGFFSGDALEQALAFLQDGAPTPSDMRVVEIVTEFERAAA